MNYLIFGGEGFIGSHLIRHLTEIKGVSPQHIYSLDIRKQDRLVIDYKYVYCDVRLPITLEIPDLDSSIVYNLAAVHITPGHPDKEYFETNILGAEHVTTFAEEHGINEINFTSSIAPYGASEQEKSEATIPMPNSPYGISKLVAEKIHMIWQTKDIEKRKLLILRPGVVFGKGEGGNFTRLYNSMKKGFFFYPGRRDTIKASVYVKDVVRILIEGGSKVISGVQLYNLSVYPAPTIEEVCETIAHVTAVSKPKVTVPAWALTLVSKMVYGLGRLIGKSFSGIHPDRVKKVMISTNINGGKLDQSELKLNYTLEQGVKDWLVDCGGESLY